MPRPLFAPALAAIAVLLSLTPDAAMAARPSWNAVLRRDAAWYATDEAREIAAQVCAFQLAEGGWFKNYDMARPHTPEEIAVALGRTGDHPPQPTIDNAATTTQLIFLARVHTAAGASGEGAEADAVRRGIDYLLDGQYESGGWPQFFPGPRGYQQHITYNDNAIARVLALLDDVAHGRAPFAWVDAARRERTAGAVQRGVACILRTQVVTPDGRRTAWCAQHDRETFAPAWARAFEPPSLSGMESVELVRFLMRDPAPSPEVVAAVEGAVAWLRSVEIHGQRVETYARDDGQPDRRVVADAAAPALWARFYELGTDRPIFLGRDRVVHYAYDEIEPERRVGYGYLGDWPAELLTRDYPRWRARLDERAAHTAAAH